MFFSGARSWLAVTLQVWEQRMSSVQLGFGRLFLFSILTLQLVQPPRAKAISTGAELLVPAIGAGSVAWGKHLGKGSFAGSLKVSGWMFVVGGATVLAVEGFVTLAVIRALVDSIQESTPNYRDHGRDGGTSVSLILNEIESDSLLAARLNSDEGVNSLGIASVARSLKMPVSAVAQTLLNAKKLADTIQGSRFGQGVKQVQPALVSSTVPPQNAAQRAALEGIVTNYLALRNIRSI